MIHNKLEHLKEDILERHSNLVTLINNLEGETKEVVDLILEANSLYNITKKGDTFENYESFIHKVVHALDDDGELFVNREIEHHLLPNLTYTISGYCRNNQKVLTANQLKRIIETLNIADDYYEKHEEQIESRPTLATNNYRKTYFTLSGLTGKIFEEIYEENKV